jgi:fructose-bisphosphate aldolase class I
MTTSTLVDTARAIVADGKGLLAADETVGTITKRFAAAGIESTADSRRDYREMFFTTPGVTAFLGGVILQDETIRQRSADGTPLIDVLARQGIIPGIKVDAGAKRLASAPGEFVTEGLDGLRDRLEAYHQMGARFAKWRGVFVIDQGLPTAACLHANAHALARYAALCQEQGLVPIVEPEVLMEGTHTIDRNEEVTGRVLHALFDALFDQGVQLEGTLLKPNMVIAGRDCPRQASTDEVAEATLRALRRHVPPAVPGVVFLSGGQTSVQATENLNAMSRMDGPKPWKLTFSFARALQDEPMRAWRGKSENVLAGKKAFYRRVRCAAAAAVGRYDSAVENDTSMGGMTWQT